MQNQICSFKILHVPTVIWLSSFLTIYFVFQSGKGRGRPKKEEKESANEDDEENNDEEEDD